MDGRYEKPIEADESCQPQSGERALIRQLVLTLTALGNYLGAAQHTMTQGPDLKDAPRRVALERALQQFSHASSIVRRLQYLSRPLCEASDGADAEPAPVPRHSELPQAGCNDGGVQRSGPVVGGRHLA